MTGWKFVRAVACILMLVVFAATTWAADIDVSQPVQVTDNAYYERGQSIIYDGTDYWLFYGRSTSCTDPYSSGNPDVYDYELYYKTAGTVAGLTSASAVAVQVGATPVGDSYMGETAAAYIDSKVWVFATIHDGTNTDLYGYYTSDGGSTWTQVGPYVAGMSGGQGHHDAVVFGGELWLLEGSGDFHTLHSSTPTNASSFSTPLQVGTTTGGLGHFFVEGTDLYLGLGSAGTYYIYIYNSGTTAWDLVDSKTISGYYDPTLYKVGSDYVFHCAPYAGGRQWIVGWAGNALDGTFFDGTEVAVIDGQYGSNVWVDMWPIGYTHGGASYLFFSSERDDPAAEGTGNIWYTEVDWDVYNDHYTYIQEAVDSAVSADRIEVDAGIYAEYLHVTTDNLTIEGAGIDQSIIDLDGLMPYWHYSGCSTSYASRGGVLLSGYGSPDEIIEDIVFRGFTVKNAGLNPPGGGAYTEFVDPGLDGQDDVRGISVQNGKSILIDECKVEHSGYFGIAAGKARCTSLTQSELVTITDCICSDNCNTGISVGDYVGPITITGNTCSNNKMPWTWYDANREYAGKGIEVIGKTSSNPPTGVISGNVCTANGYQGIVLKNYSDGMVVELNTVSGHNLDDDGAGIFFYARSSTPAYCVNDTIRDNVLSGNIRGIIGYYAQDALISGNTISTESGTFDSGQEGIKLDGCNGCVVSGNVLTDCDGTGIKAQNTWDSVECHSNTISSNTITNANGPGFRVSSGAHDNVFVGNTVEGAKFAGVFIYLGAYDNVFTDNLLTGITTETFYAGEDYEVTQGDGIFLWGYNGDFDARAGTGNVFHGNGVYGSAGDGIENQVSSMVVDASGNWWGTADASAVASLVGSYADYTPWLAGGTPASPGYSGDFSSLHVDDNSPQTGSATRLQEGHDLASGSTVNVADGIYGADPATGKAVYITKDGFNLIGQSEAGTIIDGGVGGVGSSGSYWPKGVHVQANNVTVQNFTVKGFMGDGMSSGGYGVLHRDYAHDTPGEGYIFYDGCTLDNVTVQDCYSAVYALCFTHLTVSDCTVTDNSSDGMFIARGSDYANVQGNVVTNSGDHGIWVGKCWMGLDPSDNATISNNTINGAREGGITFCGSDGAVIEGNVITNAAGEGWSVGALSLKDGVSNVVARYNTIYGNDGAWNGYAGTGHGIGIDGTPSNITLNWNGIYGNVGHGCYNYSTVDVDATHNWWGAADGPGGSGPGSGDEVSPYVPYDPWIGETGSENIVCIADPTYLDAGIPTKTVSVDYLGGGGGLMYAYTVKFTWDGAIASTAFGNVSEETLLSDEGTTFFYARSTGTNEITVDCALLGSEPGVTGPGTMFTIAFTGQNVGTSDINVTIIKVKDRNNALLGGFYEDDGLLIVDVSVPTIADVEIFNTTLAGITDDYIKDTDGARVEATVIDDDPLFGAANITADLRGLGGLEDVHPSYDSGTGLATWTIVAPTGVTCNPANGDVWVYIDATDAIGNPAGQGSDDIIADNIAPTPVTNFDAAPGHQKCDLSWTMGADSYLAGVVVQRNDNTGDYPLYTAFKGAWPNVVGFYPGSELVGTNVYNGTDTGTADAVVDRNIYYYQAFCYDIARNYGAAEVAGASADLATNYWLGDIAAAWTVWGYNGLVNDADIDKLGFVYGTINEVECDVGPTVHPDWHRLGLPTPDGIVEFEDLMIFAMNYGVVSARAVPLLTEPAVGDLALSIDEIGRSSDGTVELALRLEGNIDEVKGVTAALSHDGLEFVSARLSDEMETPAADIFFWHGERDGAVQIDLAMLGTGMTIGGSGELVHLTFQAAGDAYSVEFESASLRSAENGDLDADLAGFGSGDEIPAMFRLVQNAPNPFNPLTTIAYDVPQASAVTITVYNVSGRLVTTLVDGAVDPGRHSVIWDGRNDRGESVGSGVYFCVMETPDYRGSHKMTLLK